MKKLKYNFEALESTKKNNEKTLRHEIETLKTKIKILENKLDETKDNMRKNLKEKITRHLNLWN